MLEEKLRHFNSHFQSKQLIRLRIDNLRFTLLEDGEVEMLTKYLLKQLQL